MRFRLTPRLFGFETGFDVIGVFLCGFRLGRGLRGGGRVLSLRVGGFDVIRLRPVFPFRRSGVTDFDVTLVLLTDELRLVDPVLPVLLSGFTDLEVIRVVLEGEALLLPLGGGLFLIFVPPRLMSSVWV
jgi:hypothetical protein